MKKIKIFFACVSLFVLPLSARADFVITEVMYDLEGTDSGREWLEVKNTGSIPADLSVWKLFESDSNHKINKITESLVPALGFAVIADDPAKFGMDHPDFTGLIFDSLFSLSNTGETLILRDSDLTDIDTLSYSSAMGGNGDGHSIQKTPSGWQADIPTPGKDILLGSPEAGTSSVPIQEESEDLYSSHSSQESARTSYTPPELEISAGRARLGYVGIPLHFEAKVRSAKNFPPSNPVSSMWSMGDGARISGQFISHSYDFPGDYTVILNSRGGGAEAVSRTRIKIIKPDLRISSANENYIEVENRDGRELNLGGFVFQTETARFSVPEDTIIPPRASIKLPSSRTGLSGARDFINVADPRGKIWDAYRFPKMTDQMAINPIVTLPDGMGEKEFLERLIRAIKK